MIIKYTHYTKTDYLTYKIPDTKFEIGKMFGSISLNGMSNTIRRIGDRINQDKVVRKLFDGLEKKLKRTNIVIDIRIG